MDIITETYQENLTLSRMFNDYYKGVNYAFLDIETTGLNSAKNKVILVCLLAIHDDQMILTQYFAESKEEEKEVLKATVDFLSDMDLLITYNGASFDIPFLNKRFAFHGMDYTIPKHASFDLYQIIKKYGYKLLTDYKLKTVEKHLGINRRDTISGKESVDLYNDYVKNKNKAYKNTILLHNREDVYYLTKILPILKKYDLHRIVFENTRFIKEKKTIITHTRITSSSMNFKGLSSIPNKDYEGFHSSYDMHFNLKTNSFELTIPLYQEDEFYYIDLQEFPMNYIKKIPDPNLHEHVLLIGNNQEINYLELNQFIEKLIITILSNI